MTGALVAVGALLLAAVVGLVAKAREGRVRGVSPDVVPDEVRELLDPGAAVTLVQFSTTFCAPCRHARVVLAELAGRVPGLAHVDVDLTDRVELARRMRVLRTPTTVAVDGRGVEVLRVSGVPKGEALLGALRGHLPD